MADLELTLCVTDSMLTRPLLDGKIKPKGVKLRAQAGKGSSVSRAPRIWDLFDRSETRVCKHPVRLETHTQTELDIKQRVT